MKRILVATMAGVLFAQGATAQTFPTDDAVIRAIWQHGMVDSKAAELAQVLTDSIGPRLTGTPRSEAGQDWLVKMYTSWGVTARKERYGTWRGWRRGPTHIDLIRPRVRTLEGQMLAWSPGTNGPVEGGVVLIPEVANEAAFRQWLPEVRGRFVLMQPAQLSCRTDAEWEEYAAPGSHDRIQEAQRGLSQGYSQRIQNTGVGGGRGGGNALRGVLEEAGAAGFLQSNWQRQYGVNRVFGTNTERAPTIDLSCEDYGLLFRLAQNGQGPVLRVNAEAQMLGEIPVANTIAEIRGRELPNEYVMMSAHYDSWDGSSGATDNATGTITMLEAMRILREVYPDPKRTILVGHWNGEENGLHGSRAFAEDHPEIVQGLQALFNQDNGTGRVVRISGQGLARAEDFIGRWLAQIPTEISGQIQLQMPGSPGGGGSDYASFICHGAPAFSISSLGWGYNPYTWHTNRDTYDKIVIEDLKNNATLTAMLVYLASEDPERFDRTRAQITGRGGQPAEWPECRSPARSSGG